MKKANILKIFLTLLFLISLSFVYSNNNKVSANSCECDTGTGKCESGACYPAVKSITCGSNNDICDKAQKRYACENTELFSSATGMTPVITNKYLCPYNNGAYVDQHLVADAEKGAWSDVFNRCFCSTGDVIQQILNIAVYSISIIALILLVVGGTKYITAQNNPDKITDAKEMILAAIVGMLLVLFSVTLLKLLNQQLNPDWGIDLLNIP